MILPLLSGNAMVKPHGSFWRKSHLNFPTAMANQKFFCSASPYSPADSWSPDEHNAEKQLQPRPIMVLNYQAKGARRKTETRERERRTHKRQRQRDSERREHAILVQRESRLTMDE